MRGPRAATASWIVARQIPVRWFAFAGQPVPRVAASGTERDPGNAIVFNSLLRALVRGSETRRQRDLSRNLRCLPD
jgi:hypothetical protein